VALASRGQRDMDDGAQSITDSVELAAVRRQARRVHLYALVAGLLLTLVAFAIPAP
jgi:hypothetical protein